MSTDEWYEEPEQSEHGRKRADLIANLAYVVSGLGLIPIGLLVFNVLRMPEGTEWMLWLGTPVYFFITFLGGLWLAYMSDKPYRAAVKAGKLTWLQEHYAGMFSEKEMKQLVSFWPVDKTVDGLKQEFKFTSGSGKVWSKRYSVKANVERQERYVPAPKPVASDDGRYHSTGVDAQN